MQARIAPPEEFKRKLVYFLKMAREKVDCPVSLLHMTNRETVVTTRLAQRFARV